MKNVKEKIAPQFKVTKTIKVDDKDVEKERICMIIRKENGENVQCFNKDGVAIMANGKPLTRFVGNGTFTYRFHNINSWTLKKLVSLLKQSKELGADSIEDETEKAE